MSEAMANVDIPEIHVFGSSYNMGLSIGTTFKDMIKGRLAKDRLLHDSLLPYYASSEGRLLVDQLITNNREKYSSYYEELKGTADGSGVPFEQLVLVNLRKEIGPFVPEKKAQELLTAPDQCSVLLLCGPLAALVAHNEDADISVRGHSGVSYTAFTYAGELPSCAFGFNSHGIAFTLNATPPEACEIVPGGIGRNFVSRDLLEASSLEDALQRVQLPNLAAGHNYNIMDVRERRMVTVETASRARFAVLPIGAQPYFHANMYLRLHLQQKVNESSLHRQQRASELPPPYSAAAMLQVLGDDKDEEFPIYMRGREQDGPQTVTVCTAVFDLDARQVVVYKNNPIAQDVALRLPLMPSLSSALGS
eukprot:jgi/Mesen1/9314/ME000060S08752